MAETKGPTGSEASATGDARASAPATAAATLTVIMPVYNERDTLLEVLTRVLASPVPKEVVIVDDASVDGTRDLLRTAVEGRYPDVRVLYLERNAGKGAAIRAAIPEIRGDYAIIQDGDLEYDPQDYAALLRPATEEGAEIVYGTRFRKGRVRMRPANRAINWLLARMVRVLYSAPLTDEATCYKLFRRDVLQDLPLTCRRFEFCPEVTAKALRRGHRIVEVPIRYEARTHAQGKKIRWTDGVAAVWTLLRYRFWR